MGRTGTRPVPGGRRGCCCRQSRPNSQEILNTILSVRAGKTRLALATISRAMMIQTTVPSGIGLLFTPWNHFAFEFALGLLLDGFDKLRLQGWSSSEQRRTRAMA